MKKIAVINDISGLGKCSLTAAIPVISAMGVQACPFPTAILSNQTGYESYFCDDYTDRMDRYMEEWKKREFQPDGIYIGFLAGEQQADKILRFIEEFSGEDTWILADPIMGDHGSAFTFCTDELCEKMRIMALKAHVITPNLTEAILLLEGRQKLKEIWENISCLKQKSRLREIEKIGKRLSEEFHLKAVVITGIDGEKNDTKPQIGNLIWESQEPAWVFHEKQGGSYSGTGDLFASVLCAGLVKGMSMRMCAIKAAAFLESSIRDTVKEGTDRNEGICFESHLWELM